jgi:hypothetical protein
MQKKESTSGLQLALLAAALVGSLLAAAPLGAQSGAAPSFSERSPAQVEYSVPKETILRMTLPGPLKMSQLKAGSELDGELARPLYVVDREVLPAGSHIHLVVESVQKELVQEKKGLAERLDSVRKLGLDRKHDYQVAFRSASLTLPSEATVPLHVSFIQGGKLVRLRAKGQEAKVGESTGTALAKMAPGVGRVEAVRKEKEDLEQYRHPTVSVELEEPLTFSLAAGAAAPLPPPEQPVTLPAGTQARLLLLTRLSASENHQGDAFQARLLEPITSEGHLALPEGAMFGGHVGKVVPARRLSRPASMFLSFDQVTLSDGSTQKISGSLVSADLDRKVDMSVDSEGGLHGRGRGLKKTLGALGIGFATDRVVEETVEMAMHAAGPYVGLGASLFLFLGKHGNDVTLPRYSELEVVFERPLTIPVKGQKPAQK